MGDTPTTTTAKGTPKSLKMHRAVHELVSAKKKAGAKDDTLETSAITAGEFITAEVAKEHGLSETDLKALVGAGAVELVDVLKD